MIFSSQVFSVEKGVVVFIDNINHKNIITINNKNIKHDQIYANLVPLHLKYGDDADFNILFTLPVNYIEVVNIKLVAGAVGFLKTPKIFLVNQDKDGMTQLIYDKTVPIPSDWLNKK